MHVALNTFYNEVLSCRTARGTTAGSKTVNKAGLVIFDFKASINAKSTTLIVFSSVFPVYRFSSSHKKLKRLLALTYSTTHVGSEYTFQ